MLAPSTCCPGWALARLRTARAASACAAWAVGGGSSITCTPAPGASGQPLCLPAARPTPSVQAGAAAAGLHPADGGAPG